MEHHWIEGIFALSFFRTHCNILQLRYFIIKTS
jgi:hypothetical protein